MEDYIRLCDAADNADAAALAAARKALEDRILGEAKEIRKYINVPKTTPYAIMYLATEGLYAEIAKRIQYYDSRTNYHNGTFKLAVDGL